MRRLGIIAEDDSDVDVVKVLASKVLPRQTLVVRSFVGRGCGKLRSKSRYWASSLREQKCSILVLVHDLDTARLATLRAQLAEALDPSPIANSVIVIPVHEIEAWLLSDSVAIRRAFHLKKPVPKTANPESIPRPKERLEHVVYATSRKTKRYVNTLHNGRIAAELDLNLVRRCPSFLLLENFLRQHV